MSDINQDDIDKLLQDALVGGGESPAPASEEPSATEPDPSPALENLGGAASQDDIDALFATVGNDPEPASPPPPAPAPTPAAATPAPVDDTPALNLDGVANQDDIDALFSAVGMESAAADPEPSPANPEPEPDLSGVADQDDIDALFSAVGETTAPEPEAPNLPNAAVAAAEPADGPVDQSDINALFESQLAEAEAQADLEATQADSDLDALLSSIAGEGEAADMPSPQAPTDTETDAPRILTGSSTTVVEDIDMDELLRQVAEAAPPPPPAKPTLPNPTVGADTAILSPDVSAALASSVQIQPAAPAAPAASRPTLPAESAFVPPPAAPAGARREFSVLYGAGEVESVANQINSLLTSMAEKAHGYMQSWIAADSEAKELRARALAEERRRASLESEKSALVQQRDELRSRIHDIKGVKMAVEEARRTLETSYQAKVRELESQVTLFASEAEALKDELTRSRNQATGVDIESRRARFEVDRLKNEVESERMERLRIQRALENREKEMQALQAQSSGQASSLFIDELHRLVRRLESELDSRTAGAHEALKQLDRMETSDSMVPVVANLRASLLQALGQDADADDALKSLGREASGIKGAAAVAPERTEMVSFETALSTYNLVGAVDVAGALLREASATPSSLMKKIYQCPALRRPEITERLPDLSRLLEGLRTVQESNDRSRGSESGDSEMFYVHMFDFLHNLVKLKLINRMSGDIWRVFLDLRGRFSFVTSDKQWAEYRDNTLGRSGKL